VKRLRALATVLLLAAGALAPLSAGPSEEEKIEAVIAAVIEAYRTGDHAVMSRYYAREVTVVPSDYHPPVKGWARVEQRYRQAYASLGGMELVRENTRIERRGKVAWAVYQWRLAGLMGNQAIGAQGHTTLILQKRGRDWVIVHNHTSALPGAPAPETTSTPSPP
jgi:ketosteroid isomerase-like protein